MLLYMDNYFIQIHGMLCEYEKLEMSFVPSIVELILRKVPKSQIKLAIEDKPHVIFDAAFQVENMVGSTM